MMAAHNHKHLLHELLTEDQEPFHLNNYIATKRYQLSRKPKPPHTATTLHLKKRQPNNNNYPSLCNHACFSFSFQVDSPDVRKSPLFDFQSPSKSPNNKVFLHIPARTAAMLLEAAIRIQKQSTKTKEVKNSSGFGLFGSLLKKLKDRSSKTRKGSGKEFSIKETVAATSTSASTTTLVELDDKKGPLGFSCSCNNTGTPRLSSAGWSESNEEKSLDLETSCSSSRSDHEDEERENGCDKCFCSSPLLLSPFRFALLQSPPSPSRRTPDFLSPAASPSRHDKEEKEICEIESLQKDHVDEKEDKEQCSPVSVLDTLYEEEEEDDDDEEQEAMDGEDYDRERIYDNVQRAKHQLLQKLRRFERLADLDPIELEKRMFEQDDDEDLVGEEACACDNSYSCEGINSDALVREVFGKSNLVHPSKVPAHMKRLVSDLISEDSKSGDNDYAAITKRVCKRLDSWKEVESNTIDMMVELDFRKEIVGWKGFADEQIKETGMDIEVAIFGLLVEELAEELINRDGH